MMKLMTLNPSKKHFNKLEMLLKSVISVLIALQTKTSSSLPATINSQIVSLMVTQVSNQSCMIQLDWDWKICIQLAQKSQSKPSECISAKL